MDLTLPDHLPSQIFVLFGCLACSALESTFWATSWVSPKNAVLAVSSGAVDSPFPSHSCLHVQ
jgi:hypothetical protein